MYLFGLDLGQTTDYTALIGLEALAGDRLTQATGYNVRHIQRFPLGTSYPEIVRQVQRLLAAPAIVQVGSVLIVDGSGVGRAPVDLLREAGLQPVPVTITAGNAVYLADDLYYHVPKRDLVSGLQVMLQAGRLKFAAGLPDVQTLVSELLTYEVKFTPAGNATFNAREGAHDDLVLALALAAWYGETQARVQLFMPDPSERAKERPLDMGDPAESAFARAFGIDD